MWLYQQRKILQPSCFTIGRAFLNGNPENLPLKFVTTAIKHPEVLPLLGIMLLPITFAIYSMYHAIGKSDVRFDRCKKNKLGPHEEIGPVQRTKLYTIHPEHYRPIPELEDMKSSLKLKEEEQAACCCAK